MRKLIVIVCVAALLVAFVVAAPIEVSPFVFVITAIAAWSVATRIDLQRSAPFAHTHLRAPPA